MRRSAAAAFLFLVLAVGCRPAPIAPTVGGLVAQIVEHADAGDASFFKPYLDGAPSGGAEHLAEMIRNSGMAGNFSERTIYSARNTAARLDYCDISRGCHFQVDLVQQDGSWTIRRIWFCR